MTKNSNKNDNESRDSTCKAKILSYRETKTSQVEDKTVSVQFAGCGGFPQDDGGSLQDPQDEVDDLMSVRGCQNALEVSQAQRYQPDGGTLS